MAIALQQNPATLNLQFQLKDSFSFPLTIQYQGAPTGSPPMPPSPVPIDLTGYTFLCQAYAQGMQPIALVVTAVNLSLGQIRVTVPKGALSVSLNWTWDLTVTDSSGNARVVVNGVVGVLDTAQPGLSAIMTQNSFDNPVQL